MKVEINTVYVSKDRVAELEENTKGKDIMVLPLGDKQELIPGVVFYSAPEQEDTAPNLTEEHKSGEIDFSKAYNRLKVE